MIYSIDSLNTILRANLYSFIIKTFYTINPSTIFKPNWHINLISDYLTSINHGTIKRLIINLPPRSLKSICTSVAWPAWILGINPATRIIVASYSQMLSTKHSLDCKLVMNSKWYKNLFPNTVISKKHNQKTKFLTTVNGFRFATSILGSTTGEGGDILIIDDPHNPMYINSTIMRKRVINWFEQVFITRLNDQTNGAIVIIMQRLDINDLSGYLLRKNEWTHIKIPIETYEDITYHINNKCYSFTKGTNLYQNINTSQLMREIGAYNYAAQYLQSPKDNYSLININDIHFFDTMPNNFEYIIQSWDTAIKTTQNSNFSVCTCWGMLNNVFYLIDISRNKFKYPELKQEMERLNFKYSPRFILIEDKASGQSLIQDMVSCGYKNIVAIKPKLDKITRFASIVDIFQCGKVKFYKFATFINEILNEILLFPNSDNDDIIDSISQFLIFTKNNTKFNKPRIRQF